MEKPTTSLWIIDAIKTIASQLIVWHHFSLYGPMAETLRPYSAGLIDWFSTDARLVVQAFLVVGGFLAARSLAPRPQEPLFEPIGRVLFRLMWHRYIRLLRPYVVVLVLAIVFAALSRQMLSHADTPAVPTFLQILIHILLMHDIIHVNALSAGVWYVAIDFQLYVVFLIMLWGSQKVAQRYRIEMRTMALVLVLVLSTSSLLWFNRDPSMDEWAFYFFGAYSLGIMVQWSDGFTRKHPWLAIFLGVVIVALALEWRSRLAIAVATALIIGIGLQVSPVLHKSIHAVFAWLSRISYSVFLIHYPVVLLVGSVVASVWPNHVTMSAAGLLVAWGLTLWGGSVLYQHVEQGRLFRM